MTWHVFVSRHSVLCGGKICSERIVRVCSLCAFSGGDIEGWGLLEEGVDVGGREWCVHVWVICSRDGQRDTLSGWASPFLSWTCYSIPSHLTNA